MRRRSPKQNPHGGLARRGECDGFADLQLALRPFVVDRLPSVSGHGGSRRGATVQGDNVTMKGRGNGEEYLLRRLKKHDAERGEWYTQSPPPNS